MKSLVKPHAKPPVAVSDLNRALAKADTPEKILKIEADLDLMENWMKETGLYDIDEIRPVNEIRMWARWKLGAALAKMERGTGPGRGKKVLTDLTSFRAYIKKLGITPPTSMQAQRIATLPENELEKELTRAAKLAKLTHFVDLLERARPYWYQASRKARHKKIVEGAKQSDEPLGPFPLIYADPPWKFQTYSEKGLDRTPDQHYPTLSDDEISDFRVADKKIADIATRDAALLLWCTSSNLTRALKIMAAWGFEYRTHAVWVKTKDDGAVWTGTGLVFRNGHELLLYGIRGKMPGPQYQPPSVFMYRRGRHSEKPREIRAAIEKMYPDFDERTRLELFAREAAKGWCVYGYEARSLVA